MTKIELYIEKILDTITDFIWDNTLICMIISLIIITITGAFLKMNETQLIEPQEKTVPIDTVMTIPIDTIEIDGVPAIRYKIIKK